MTTKYLTGAYPGGYGLNPKYVELVIEATATVGGTGVLADFNATIENNGLVHATTGNYSVGLSAGGTVVNGSLANPTALIEGFDGVVIGGAAGSVTNYGTIVSTATAEFGVLLLDGGSVTNGAAGNDTTALITGFDGVIVNSATSSVANFGTIAAAAGGVVLAAGGSLTNGNASDRVALISGESGLSLFGVSTVVNSGTIEGTGLKPSYAINMDPTATSVALTNGSLTNTAALIEGYGGAQLLGVSTVLNFGTILGTGADVAAGVYIAGDVRVTNGGASDTAALISGYYGVNAGGAGTIDNLGTIRGTGSAGGSGINVSAAGLDLTNGSTKDATALIKGYAGVTVGHAATSTVTNFGTIIGTGGTAVQFESSAEVLAVEAGSAFVGSVLGDGGAVELASGVGAITVAQASGNLNVTVSGSMATTTFTNFATVEVGLGASFTLTGDAVIAAGQTLVDSGAVTVSGAVDQTGAVTVGGTATKAALLTIAAGATWDIENHSGIALATSTKGSITIKGTLTKTLGAAPSVVGLSVVDSGFIVAASGALDLAGAITGSGAMSVDTGAKLEMESSVASTLKLTFGGGNAVLALGDPSAFAATIHGFAVADTIDLLHIAATTAVLGSGDELVISNGSTTVATLKLSGNYTRDTFAVAPDGNGGNNITFTSGAARPSPTSLAIASPSTDTTAPHRFIAAMAGFAAGAGEAAAAMGDVHSDTGRFLLTSPQPRSV